MTANEKLEARIASLPTEQIVEIATRLNLVATTEAIIVCNRCDRELSKRMTEEQFGEHIAAMEAMLDAAA